MFHGHDKPLYPQWLEISREFCGRIEYLFTVLRSLVGNWLFDISVKREMYLVLLYAVSYVLHNFFNFVNMCNDQT